MKKNHIKVAIRALFSFHFLKALVSSVGYYVYEHVLWRKMISSGKGIRVHATASIRNPQNIYIGNNSHINMNCYIWCGENSKITLGNNLLMGPDVKIFSTNHGMSLNSPMTFQDLIEQDVIIGNDCWLGAGTIILKGVKIPDGCVIAAGSVVTKTLPEQYAIYAGNPVKKLRERE